MTGDAAMGSFKPPRDRAASGRCPICTAPTDAPYRPFCSKRCADIDLSRWLRGGYVIAGGDSDADEDGEGTAAAPHPANRGADSDADE